MKLFRLSAMLLWAATVVGRAETVFWSDGLETNGPSRWTTNSVWRIGSPTSGPAANSLGYRTHSGTNCASTQNYAYNSDSRIICTNYNGSSTLLVPDASLYPRLRFWHWFNYANALGYVEISANNGGSWTQLSQTYQNITGGGVWSRPSFDLSAYAGQSIQIAFHFTSGGCCGNGLGWFIDDVDVVTGSPAMNEPESFESGGGDWAVNAGTWEIGNPTSGPNSAHSGTNCAATILAGNYPNNVDTRLVSPAFTVPANNGPFLRFWQWINFNNALGYVEISINNGGTWNQLSPTYQNITTGGAWINTSLDLSSYAGQTAQVAFHFTSGGVYTAAGWYVDDVEVTNDPPVIGITTSAQYATPNNNDIGKFTITRSGAITNAVTINLAVSGTASAGSDYTALPASVQFAANQTSTNLYVYAINTSMAAAETVVLSLVSSTAYLPGLTTTAAVTLLPNSSLTNSVNSPVGRYWRGSGSDPTYWSIVVPLNYETGTVYSNLNGNCASLYSGLPSWSSQTNYHYNATNPLPQTSVTNRIPFNNPIVALGERVGGTPLYFGQPYSIGIYGGDPAMSNQPVVIQVYYRTNYQLAGTISMYPPTTSANAYSNYVNTGYQMITNAFGLTTTLSGAPFLSWGEPTTGAYVWSSSGGYVLTHTASNQATNYYYVVGVSGNPTGNSNPMVVNSSGQIAPSLLYSLEFEQRPQWRSVFLDQPHFNGSPLPPFYAGKTLAEMLTNTPPVTNVVSLAPAVATNLDDSPELRRNPILDNFVASMGNDPIALANYVINQVGLTDPIDYNDTGSVAEDSINPGGVARGALGTFLEKQGSPAEECALLVYLLRQAGVPAVYEFAPHNGLQMLDARLSQMLKFQVHGDINSAGQLYTTNAMIPVNYPWVAAYIGTNWVHIFPWLKDCEINEGLNLFDEMPTNYSNAYDWVHDYIYGNTNLLSLAVDGDNTPRVIFPRFLQQTLLQNHPGVSVDDIGVKIINRQHYYARWQDFPTPTWLTNLSTSIESLSASAITNVNPALTNLFDTLSVEIYSLNDPTKDINTGNMRLVDLHNREFYIYQSLTNGSVRLNLVLTPFRTNVTTQLAFSNDPNLLSKEVLSLTFDSNDYQLGVRFRYHRNPAITPSYAINPYQVFLGLNGYHEVDIERPLLVGDQAAICLNYGQVTHDMLNVQAANLWQMENTLRASPALTNSVSPDVYEGAMMYLAGMSYFEKESEFQQLNQQLQKFDQLSLFEAGLSKITPGRDSSGNMTNGTDPRLPGVDMMTYQTMLAGNGTLTPASGQDYTMAEWNYNVLGIANSSAEEHQVINRFYQQTNAVSTVRLLQLAQSSGAGIVALNVYNYVAQGQTVYQGKALQSWDTSMWQQVTNALGLGFVSVYMTPGPMTNSAYKGMGALILNPYGYFALISPFNLNGGVAGQNLPANAVAAPNTPNYNLNDNNGDYAITLSQPTTGSTLLSGQTASFNVPTVFNQTVSGDYVITPVASIIAANEAILLGLPPGTSLTAIATDNETATQSGVLGNPSYASQLFTKIADPVNNMTGEFYDDETDLQLPGPIPLALRRNYSSQNLANNQFGYGWKLSIMPYLSVSKGSTNIYAADMDGSVLAYVHSTSNTNLWSPTLAANPQLNNNTTAGAGGMVNRLRDYILRSVTGSATNYTLYGADGGVRVFQFMNFNSGTITNTRPYLLQWTDNRGNYYTFSYDTNPADANFGQMQQIRCSNGNYLDFDYDIYGHMIDAYSGDGRWMYYDYDDYGDLVAVTLPDNTTRSYQYLHSTQAVTNSGVVSQQTYSTHLIIEEDKPDGRELINAYDSQRRVTNQLSTAGMDLNPIRTATFVYSNNFNLTNSFTNTITGYTLIVDGNGYTNRYDYTNSLIAKITDPLGQTIQQSWYADNATAPGYPRSVATRTDKRGLVTQYQFDPNGNVTNAMVTGDLTGEGIATQTATNTAVYNTNSLPLQLTDPVGNSTVIVYDPVFNFLPQQTIRYSGTTPVSTNFTFYGNATNLVVNGSVTQTNLAFGLPTRQIRACGSPDAATNDLAYNGNGFPTQSIHFTGTSDPNVTNTFFYNEREQMVNQVDALGAITFFDYDALNRPIEQVNFDEFGNAVSWNFNYYTDNGELSWVDGPRYNPEDYIFYDYDGAGRRTTEIHWRSEAKADGSGVEAPAGYNQYAQSFYQHDPLGNLILAVDPRGAMTANTWDALSQLAQRKHLDIDGVTVLSVDSFGYEPGGKEKYHTNALGGVTTTLYTTNGLPKYRSNPDGSTNGWTYYLDGRIKREYQGNGAYWQTTYNDSLRSATRIFYSATGFSLATNITVLDRRGNVVQKVDAGNNVFTTAFDGLDRVKVSAGPAIVTVSSQLSGSDPNGPITYVTNILQQAGTNFYDAANRSVTNINALGEKTATRLDALGRTTSTKISSATGGLVREKYFTYSADHNSVTVTDGSGASAISHTTWTDNDGHSVLSIAYPSSGVSEFTLNQFDLAGNPIAALHDSSASGSVTNWTTTSLTYDGLNRPTQKVDRDNAVTTLAYDALNDLTSRILPGSNLVWSAVYTNSGQRIQDWNTGGGTGTRTNKYAYFPSGSAFAGLLQTQVDGRNTTNTLAYDNWLRVTNNTRTGLLPEQNVTTAWQYEPRGFVTSYSEAFASTNTGPATSVQRTFDPYGQVATESVNGGTFGYSAYQGWDAAGRRTQLSIGGASYGFVWQADGGLVSASDATGNGSYGFDTAGWLTSRTVGNRLTSIAARDGEGHPLSINTTVNLGSQLTETLTWSGDGLLATHTLIRNNDFTDSRSYAYANLSRRLTQEQLNLNAATAWTNNFAYDNATASGPGVLTGQGQGSALWSGVPDAFSRVAMETNNLISFAAYGHVNGQSTLSAWLDNLPISVASVGTNAMQWRAAMELSAGSHQLQVAALHPSGQYIALATNIFTNSIAYQTTADIFDGAGNTTQRIWRNPNGTTNKIQTLSWDARGRLHAMTERDASNSGYNWTAIYDALNRRLSTTSVLVTNGVAIPAPPTTINSYLDPQVEFLELGVSYGTKTEWKLMGPDLNGVYGGLNGTGGFDAVSPGLNAFNPVISDFRGNILAEVTNGAVNWFQSRPTGYGAVPGYRPPILGSSGTDLAQASAWRGRWMDITWHYNLGLRPYYSVAANWLANDSVVDERNPNSRTFCGGDCINGFDADGRCVETLGSGAEQLVDTSIRQANAVAGWADDMAINAVAGGVALADKGFSLAAQAMGSDSSGFDQDAQKWGSYMSPYAKTGYYDPNNPGVQIATAATIFANPESAAGKVSSIEVGSGNAYSVAYQMKMEIPDIPVGTRYAHFQSANEAMFASMDADPEFASAMQKMIPDINTIRGTAEAPQDWVWNHFASEPGVMQLVPTVQHWSPNPLWSMFHPIVDGKNVGGFKLWGQQY